MKIHRVKKARRAHGNCRRCSKPISRGDSYYWFKHRRWKKTVFCIDHHPRRSEMSLSGKLATLYAIQESFTGHKDIGSLKDWIENAISDIEGVGDEYDESADNVDEYFSGSAQVDEIRDKAISCRSWAEELQLALEEIEGMPDEEIDDALEVVEGAVSELAL